MPKLVKLSQTILVSLIGASLVLILFVYGYGLSKIQHELLDRTGEVLELAAVAIAGEWDQVVAERTKDMRIMAHSPMFVSSEPQAMKEYFHSLTDTSTGFSWLGFLDPQGQEVVANGLAPLNQNIRDLAAFQESRQTKALAMQVVPYSTGLPGPRVLMLAFPVFHLSGELSGVIVGALNIAVVEKIAAGSLAAISTNLQKSLPVEWQMVTVNGEVLLDSVLQEEGQVNLATLLVPSALRLTQQPHGHIQEQHGRRHVPVLTGFARTQAMGNLSTDHWGVLVRANREDVLSTTHAFIFQLALAGGLLLLPVFGLVFWMSRRWQRAHHDIIEAEKKYRGIFENAQEGIFQTSHTGQYLNANPALAHMYGFQSPQDLMDHFQNIETQLYVDPNHRHRFLQLMEEFGKVEQFESQIVRVDGEIRWISENAYVVHDSSGQVLYYEGTVKDVTDRRHAEQERDRFFDLSLDLLCVASMDGYFKRVNPAFTKTLGFSAEELVAKPFTEFVYPEDRESTLQALQGLRKGQPVIDFVNRYASQNGKLHWLQWRAVSDLEGGLIFAVARDITEVKEQERQRRKLESQVQHSQKMQAIGTLAGGIAHDFNNILSAILGYSGLALHHISENSPAVRHVQEVLTAGNRAKDLVGQILAFSRHQDPVRKPVEFQVLLDEALRLLKPTQPSMITVRFRSHVSNSMILADSTQIHQVVVNLCTNAVQAMGGERGQLDLLLEAIQVPRDINSLSQHVLPGPYLRLMVHDSGHGMTREVLDRVFEPFFTTKKPGEGTGMGLAMVHGIMTNHHGAITIDSVLGEGTTACMYLPHLLESPEPSVETGVTLPNGHGCILFVDDEEILCRLHQEMLENLGYEVVVRTSSLEALEEFRKSPTRFDLVMTDQTMPTMTGPALIKELRKLRPAIPVIVCSGYSDFLPEEATTSLEIQARLYKPVAYGELAVTVREVLEHCQQAVL